MTLPAHKTPSLALWAKLPMFSARMTRSLSREDSASLGWADGSSGWLVAALRFNGRAWQIATSPQLAKDESWEAFATRSLGPISCSAPELRLALAWEALKTIAGLQMAPEGLRIQRQALCDACDRPLCSSALLRTVPADSALGQNGLDLSGREVTVGPECWQRLTGERAARAAAKRAARAAALASLGLGAAPTAPTAPSAAPRCNGTCALGVVCPDCD